MYLHIIGIKKKILDPPENGLTYAKGFRDIVYTDSDKHIQTIA